MTRRWQTYRGYSTAGDWHVHTDYSHGSMSVKDACEAASELGLSYILFSEHVRKDLTYSYEEFCREIEENRKGRTIRILKGAEAKILDKAGSLDVDDGVLGRAELLSMSFHTNERLKAKYVLSAITGAMANWPVDVWAHPASVLLSLDEKDALEALALAHDNGVAIELNIKYSPVEFLKLLKKAGLPFVTATDAHCADEMRQRWSLWQRLEKEAARGTAEIKNR